MAVTNDFFSAKSDKNKYNVVLAVPVDILISKQYIENEMIIPSFHTSVGSHLTSGQASSRTRLQEDTPPGGHASRRTRLQADTPPAKL